MTDITYYTDKQLEIDKIIQSLGIRTKLEEDVEQYKVDISCQELKIAVEIDGPSHRKLPKEGRLIDLNQRQASKRDKVLLFFK